MIDHGKVDPKLISIAKYFAGEVGVKVANEALQLHGGYGYIADYDIERFYEMLRSSRSMRGPKRSKKIPLPGSSWGDYRR